jgi:hypothetical protein
MRSTLDEILAVLDDLHAFASSVDSVHAALAGHRDPAISRHSSVRRRLDGTAFIVVLYAGFENFIEDLCWAFVEFQASSKSYAELHEKLRGKHLQQSVALLSKARLGEGRYAGLTDATIVENLHLCLSGQSPYKLNRDAVIHHEGNFRADIVNKAFGVLGIENLHHSLRTVEPLVQWHAATHGAPPDDPVPLRTIEQRLESFVTHRNQVSHSGAGPSNLLGRDDMLELVAFVRSYCLSLYELVAREFVTHRYVMNRTVAVTLGPMVEGPFKRGTVAVVNRPPCRVYVNQPIFGVRAGRVDGFGWLKEIKVEDQSVESIEVGSEVSTIGLRVDFRIADQTVLHVLPDRDHIVWL